MKIIVKYILIICIALLTLLLSTNLTALYANTDEDSEIRAQSNQSATENQSESAETDSDKDADEEEIDAGEIEVEGEKPATDDSLPGQDSVYVPFDEFDLRTGGIASILDRIAGLDIRSLGGAQNLSTLSIRGAAPHQSSIYLNGIPLSPETSGVFDLSLLPTGAVQGALIERGTRALGGGFAGSVDLRLSPAIDSSFRVSYGSFDSRLVNVTQPFSIANSTGAVFATHSSTDGDFSFKRHDGLEYNRQNNSHTFNSLAVVMENGEGRISRNLTLVVSNKSGGVPGMSEFPSPEAHQEDTVVFAGYSYRDKDYLKGELSTTVYARITQTNFDDPSPYLGNPIETDQSEYGAGLSVGYRRSYGNSILGAKIDLDAVKLDDEDYGNPSRTTGSFTLWRECYINDLTIATAVSASLDSESEPGWKGNVGLVYDLGAGFSVESTTAHSFRRPNFSELYYPESGYIGGNPDLNDESGLFFDVGLKYESETVDISVRGFSERFNESIQFVPVTLYRIRAENTGAVRIRGISAEGVYKINQELSLTGSLTKLDAEYLDGGLSMAGRTPLKYAISLNGEHSRFVWKLGWLHSDSAPVDRFGNLRTHASDDLTCGFQIELTEGLTLGLTASNLLNDDLRDSLDFPLPGRNYEIGFEYVW